MAEEMTAKIKLDISDLKANVQEANRQIKLANAQFKAAASGMDNWENSTDGVTKKINSLKTVLSSQKSVLSSYESQLELITEEYGENSKEADNMRIKIANQQTAINKTSSELKTYESRLTSLEAEQGKAADSTEDQRSAYEKLQDTISDQQDKLDDLKQEYAKVVLEQGKNSDAAKELGDEISDLSKELKENKDKLDDAENAANDLDESFEEVDQSSANLSEGFTVMKGVLANLIADGIRMAISAFKDLATSVVDVGSNFEKSMSNVGAISGATEEELELLNETAKKFGSTTQFSASEAADALGYMALAGWDANTSTSALGGVLDLAAASGMDLASASDMVTDYMSAFGMQASESAYFADLLAYAQSNANTTAEGLGEAFKNCAANLNASGQDIETTTALLSMMANQGLKGSEAGTALTAVVRDMTAKMKDGAIQIGETSVKVQDSEGNFRDLTDILKDVENATDGMGDAQKSAALMSTFTSDSIKGLNLILNAGVDEAASFEEELRKCNGTASKMAKTMNDNLAGDLTALNSKIEGVKITVYESLVPALRDGIDEISGVIDSIDWSDVGKELGEVATKAVKFFKAIITNADGIIAVLKSVGTVLVATFVVNKITSFITTIGTVITTFKTLKTATEAATASQKLLNLAQAATPIGLVTAAVAGLATGLVYLIGKNDETKESIKTLTEFEQEQVDKVYEMRDAYNELSTARDESVNAISEEYQHYESLATELDGLVDANGKVKEGYEDRANFIVTTLNEAVGTEMELVDGVIQNYNNEKDAIYNLIEAKKAEAILKANEEAYTTAIQNRDEALQNYITTEGIYKQNKADLEEAEKKYKASLEMTSAEYAKLHGLETDLGVASQMLEMEQKALGAEFDAARGAIGESRRAMEVAEDTYVGYQATIQNYEGLSSAIISGDADKIASALTNMKNNFITAETGTRDSLERQVRDMETNYENLKKAIESGSEVVTKEMVDEAKQMVDAAKVELDKFPPEAETKANNAANTYATTLGSPTNQGKVKSNSILLRDSANSGLQPNGKEKTAGDNLTLGYISGMEINADGTFKKAKGLSSTAVDGLNEGQDSHSPSRATTTSGENFGQGFINGMDNKTNSIWDKAWNLAKTALNALKKSQEEGSPSKITTQSGKFFGQGFANGISLMVKPVINEATNLVASAIDAANEEMSNNQVDLSNMFTEAIGLSNDNILSADARGWVSQSVKELQGAVNFESASKGSENAQVINNYNFTQNNTSPKALSRLEIYRQTKNQLSFAREV